jgi:hypothetical protein
VAERNVGGRKCEKYKNLEDALSVVILQPRLTEVITYLENGFKKSEMNNFIGNEIIKITATCLNTFKVINSNISIKSNSNPNTKKCHIRLWRIGIRNVIGF